MTSLLSINLHGKLQFACLIGGRVCNPRQQNAYSRLACLVLNKLTLY